MIAEKLMGVSDQVIETKAAGHSNFSAEQGAYLKARAAKQIADISETLREEISQLILEMVQQGKPNNAIAKELVKLSPEISKKRAAVIARTETHQSALAAIDASLKYKKIVVRTKTWWSAQDQRVRASHREAHGRSSTTTNRLTGGAKLMRPGDQSLGAGPEEVVACRCAVLFSTAEAASPVVATNPWHHRVD